MNSSAHSVAELTKAESDIDTMCKKLDAVIRKWQQVQRKEIADFKTEATAVEKKISSQEAKLQALLDNDITIGTLVTKLTQENPDLVLRPLALTRQNRYNFAGRCETLSDSILAVIKSQDFVSSKLLKAPQYSGTTSSPNSSMPGTLPLQYIIFIGQDFYIFF